jgi:DNA polymerase-3 subunit delta'
VQQTVDGWRVIVIEPAEALNIASANALLKTLEEPGERVLIILLADHYLKLPATIRSRLQHFAMDRITPIQTEQYLQQQLPVEKHAQIQLLMNLSNNMPLQAQSLAELDWLNRRGEFLQDWFKLVSQKSMPMQFASKWNKELSFYDLIQMFEYLLSDIICVKLNQVVKNSDLVFSEIATQYDLQTLFSIYENLQQAKLKVDQNVQTNLIIDQLTIQLMNVT